MIISNPEIIDLSLVTTYDVSFNGLTSTAFIKGSNASVNVIGTTGTAIEYGQITFLYGANVTGGSVQIFGVSMPEQLLNTPHIIQCNYFGGNWYVSFNANIGSAGFIVNDNIAGNASISFNKLEALTPNRATITTAVGQLTSSSTTDTDLAKLSAITVSATDINRVGATISLTADLNILTGADAAGLTPTELQRLIGVTSNIQTQLNAKANNADFSGILAIKQFSVTIPSAEVLTLGTTPVILVPAQGANTIIVPISIQGQLVYNTTPYATDDEIDIYNGGTNQIFSFPTGNAFLFGTVAKTINAVPSIISNATDTQYVANSPLTIFMAGGNPTAGDSDLIISGIYYIKTI